MLPPVMLLPIDYWDVSNHAEPIKRVASSRVSIAPFSDYVFVIMASLLALLFDIDLTASLEMRIYDSEFIVIYMVL